MRPAPLALAAFALAALACTSDETPSCPGAAVATFRLKGPLVSAGDPRLPPLDPSIAALPDCTPDLLDETAPIRYPHLLEFDAKLAADPDGTAAALCRPNGVVYSGQHAGATYSVEAAADPAVLCGSVCAASLRVVVVGDVATDAGGVPVAFQGALVEALTELRGACDACLPLVPGDPPVRACAARYALAGAAL